MKVRFAADDWGLSPAINAGILRLAQKGWLHSASLMANAPYLREGLDELLTYAACGLHFSLHLNFTYGRPLSPREDVTSLVNPHTGLFYSHRSLVLRGLTRRIRAEHVIREFSEQLSLLRDMGIPVSGLDGHHHIHLLPGVAAPLHDALLRFGLSSIRLMQDREHRPSFLQTFWYKTFIAPQSSSLYFEPCEYLLPQDLESRERFQRKLARAKAPLLVHPALYNDFESSGMLDTLRDERVHELHAIMKYMNE